MLWIGIVLRGTDPDPDFHFDAEPDTDPEWHQTDAGPHDPTLSCKFTHVRKCQNREKKCTFIDSKVTIFFLSHKWQW